MSRFAAALVGALSVGSVMVFPAASATSAASATGTVLVFSNELSPVTVYENPSGCQVLPVAAHVLINRTDQKVTVYSDPLCLVPNLSIPEGYGTHVSPVSASFSV